MVQYNVKKTSTYLTNGADCTRVVPGKSSDCGRAGVDACFDMLGRGGASLALWLWSPLELSSPAPESGTFLCDMSSGCGSGRGRERGVPSG